MKKIGFLLFILLFPFLIYAAELTSTQQIKMAKKALATNYNPSNDALKATWGNLYEAEDRLKSIKKFENANDKKETDRLLKEIERRKNKVAVKRNLLPIDRFFLDNGLDVIMRVESSEKGIERNDVIELIHPFWSRPLVHKITNGGDIKEGSFLAILKKIGFSFVVFNNEKGGERAFVQAFDLKDGSSSIAK